jgi:hypothetical protein
MKRLGVLVLVLVFCGGCMTEETRKQWQEAWRDLNGDNIQMHNSPIDRTIRKDLQD